MLRELDVEQDVQVTARLSRFLRTNTCVVPRNHALSLNNLDGARRRDLINRNHQATAVHCCHFDRSALKRVVQCQLVPVDEAVSVFPFEVGTVGASWAGNLLEANLEVSGWELCLLVALTSESHRMREDHAWLDHDSHGGFLLLNRAAIKTQNLLRVGDFLASTVVHLFESHVDRHADILGRLRLGLVQASVGSAKVTALDLEVSSRDFSKIGAQVVEWV